MPERSERRVPLPLLAIALLALCLGGVWLGLQPPAVAAPAGSSDRFSGGRAGATLQRLLAEGVPHPVGSDANRRVGDRVQGELRSMGYEPAVQETWVCGRHSVCAPVRNIIARLPGREPGPAVMLSTHYDGVPAAPAAADDGAGVAAALEVARMLRDDAPFRNPIIFLFGDGEEAGLLGAEAFVAEHPLADSIGVVVNLEARGSGGPSLMFETSEGNGRLVAGYAAAVHRPNTSSLYFEAYRRLPNDTDLTVFKRAGMQGLGFAFIDGLAHYHTPLDDLQHLDLRSLQHHGDNALALTRRFADADLTLAARGNTVYTDVFSLLLLRWPAAATLPWALVVLLSLAALSAVGVRSGRLRGRDLVMGAVAAMLVPVATAAWAWLVTLLISGLLGEPDPWWAEPLPFRMLLWSGALIATAVIGSWFGRRRGAPGLLAGAWLVWALLATVSAVMVVGVSYLFLLPATVAAVAALFAARAAPPRRELLLHAGAVAALAAAGVLWFRLALGLDSAFGLSAGVLISAVLGVALAPLAPLFAGDQQRWARPIIAGAAVVAVAAAIVALLVPVRTQSWPQPANLLLVEDADSGTARWAVSGPPSGPPPELYSLLDFDVEPRALYPWTTRRFIAAKGQPTGEQSPEFALTERRETGSARTVRGRVRSPRGAYAAELHLAAGDRLREIRVAGHPAVAIERNGYHSLRTFGLPRDGVEVELTIEGAAPIDAYLADSASRLPARADATALAASRSAAGYTPIHTGDVSVVFGRLRL